MTGERAALNILLRVTQEGAYLNLELKNGFGGVREEDIPRLTALVYTSVERLSYCDFYIERFAKGRLHSSVRGILRLALTELFFMNTPVYAVCSRYVALTGEIGKTKLKGYVNGVLRNIIRCRESGALPELPTDFCERQAVLSGYPSFIIKEYVRKYGEEFTSKLLEGRVLDNSLRAVRPLTRDGLIERLSEMGVNARKSALVKDGVLVDSLNRDVLNGELFSSGKITVQSESAMLACVCLDPKQGDRVLDACAAPGGKTAYLYDLSEGKADITAWDVRPHRVELIKNTLNRLHVSGVSASVHDASVPDAWLNESFDKILCDVPCSGLGGGSKPDARLRRTEESIVGLSALQYSILDACSKYLKKGGSLV